MIGLHVGNVYDWMNVHGVGKMKFNGIGPDQLRDGIGTKPSLREFPRGVGEMEIVGQKPDAISCGIRWSIRAQAVCLSEDAGMSFDQVVIGS